MLHARKNFRSILVHVTPFVLRGGMLFPASRSRGWPDRALVKKLHHAFVRPDHAGVVLVRTVARVEPAAEICPNLWIKFWDPKSCLTRSVFWGWAAQRRRAIAKVFWAIGQQLAFDFPDRQRWEVWDKTTAVVGQNLVYECGHVVRGQNWFQKIAVLEERENDQTAEIPRSGEM